MKLLTENQYKLNKSVARGYKTVGISLSPDVEARLVLKDPSMPTMCAMSGTCAEVCLVKTGMNVFPASAKTRALKTRLWIKEQGTFINQAVKEIRLAEGRARQAGLKLAVRPNLLSDQPKLAQKLAVLCPNIQFYDYTKLSNPRKQMLDNYHLTYSVSERTTAHDLRLCYMNGVNVAVVVAVAKGAPLPTTFKIMGKTMPVIDGDKDDLRFLDEEDRVVMLRWKGSKARMLEGVAGGFVIDPTKELVR